MPLSPPLSDTTLQHKPRPFRCAGYGNCTSSFTRRHDLDRHIGTVHHKQRGNICYWLSETTGLPCLKGFGQKTHLITHINTHTGMKPYICRNADCTRAFGDPSALSRHRRAAGHPRGNDLPHDIEPVVDPTPPARVDSAEDIYERFFKSYAAQSNTVEAPAGVPVPPAGFEPAEYTQWLHDTLHSQNNTVEAPANGPDPPTLFESAQDPGALYLLDNLQPQINTVEAPASTTPRAEWTMDPDFIAQWDAWVADEEAQGRYWCPS